MRFATYAENAGPARAGVVSDAGIHPLPAGVTVLGLVRAGLSAALAAGTCGNGGCLAELWGRSGTMNPPPLRPGDVVELAVEGIGSVRNRVVAGITLPPVREARDRSVPRSRKRG